MDILEEILDKEAKKNEKYKATDVTKNVELEFDIGNLLATDTNELDLKQLKSSKEDYLKILARDNTQLLLNKIWELPLERREEIVVAQLPVGTTRLPREKPCPKPRPLTKWQEYALEKGIKKKKKTNLVWDDMVQKWVPRFGYRKAELEKQKDWVLEVPGNADPMEDQFAKKAEKKKEKVSKNEFQRLRNIAKAKNIKVPKEGLPPVEKPSSALLTTATDVARVSTASLGKFQPKLPKEKAIKQNAIVQKRAKRDHSKISSNDEKTSQLKIIEGILGKKPKLDLEKALGRHVEQQDASDERKPKKAKGGKKGRKKSIPSKARKGGKVSKARVGKVDTRKSKGGIGGGRKRR
ncbi:ribosome biogenesis regulatory protein homolog [Neocloeon triangulifer]|uniref:ribosome biogenesis regulatory protein homolog n=1 Tax=Neocloeon triangulifer TaxID=2078957 RepID=UPI00286F89B4|nr:ribosome biogenesis regulatory protein homolog [Neocloeon triangulifer]